MFENVSPIAKVRFKTFFDPSTYTMTTPTSITLPHSHCACGVIKKSLIYSTRKAFLERAVVVLVYKFDEKSIVFEKVSRTLKCQVIHVYIALSM